MSNTYAVFFSVEEGGETRWYASSDGGVVSIDSSPDTNSYGQNYYRHLVFEGGFVSIRSSQPVATAFDADYPNWMYVATQRNKAELERFCRSFFTKISEGLIVDPRQRTPLDGKILFVKAVVRPRLPKAEWDALLKRIEAVLAECVDRV
jgi:hypothetical protein